MVGILGFAKNNLNLDINKMADATLYMKKVIRGQNYEDENINIAETKLKFSSNMPITDEDFVVFANGTIYNLDDINEKFDISSDCIEILLYKASQKGILENVLNVADGIFQAVIYDKINKKIKLITDRFGVRFIYYYFKDGQFAFASELKSLINNEVDLSVEPKAFESFMDLGFMYDDITWFKNIKLIKPSSIIEYDIDSESINQKYYWKYSEIKQVDLPYAECVSRLSGLFEKAIEKRYSENDQIMVPVSGGLDSRMIVASFSKFEKIPNLNMATFGQEGCRDIEIAKKIAKVLKQSHKSINIGGGNEDAITARRDLVWCTDGVLSIQHMHGMDKVETSYDDEITTIFHGAAGGEIYGCVYHPIDNKWGAFPLKENYHHIYGKHVEGMDIDAEYYQIPQFHPVIMSNSLRRFGYNSLQYMMGRFNICIPFLDNDLIEFIFSVPEIYRKDYKLYFDALNKAFPYWYTKIPFQSAGGFNTETYWQKCKRRLKEKIKKLLGKKQQYHFFDYNKYIKMDSTQVIIEKILKEPNKFLINQNYDFISDYKNKHMDEIKYNADLVLKLVTMKLYFDKIAEVVDDKFQ